MRMMSFEPMFSIMNDNGDFNNIEPPAPGSLDIDKWATPVDGSSNLWRIDLTLTGKNIPTTSDIVLVIDRSGSMSGSKLTAAKDAATNFVNTLLGDPNNLSTRIAVVSFAGNVTVHNQSEPFKDYTGKADLLAAISGLNASGGTHTQAGLKQANALLSSSTANYKNIVLLSDGEPTYSYAINDFNSKRNSTYFEKYGNNWQNNWQNKDSLAVSDYNYSSNKGTGNSIRTYESSTGGSNYYYNHGNSAVAEAGYAKSAGVIVYSVGLSAGPSGQSVLDGAASPGKSYTASDSDLNAIFQTIAGSIAFAATGAVITDPMGGMFGIEQINETNYQDKIHVNRGTVSWDNGTETITWSLATISEGNPATMWYIVEISEDAVSGVVYPTNKHTYVTYTNAYDEDAQKSFPIPDVGINAGTIKVHYYRVNEDGDPINSLGDPIEMIQAIMQTVTFMEGTDLKLNTPYEVTGPSTVNIGGEDYYYNPTNNIGDNSPKTVTLTPSNTSEDVYFPYTKQTNVTVTFDDNYVGAPATYTRTTGKGTSLGVEMPSDPIRAKYIFNGWNTLADGKGTAFTSSTIINNDLTVYAQWSRNIGATLSISDYSGVYDSAAHSITINNLVRDDVVYYSLTNNGSDWTTTKPEFTNVTTGSVTVYVKVENANYQDRTGSGTVTITPKPITISSGDASKTYDGTALTNNTHSITAGGLAPDEVIDSVNISGTITNAGSVPNTISSAVIKDGSIDTTSNYTITYDPGTLTINKVTIVLTADSNSKVYDGSPLTDPGWNLTSGSLISGDVLQVTVVGSITNVGTEDNEITLVKVMNGAEDVTANYTITEVDGLLTVTKKAVMITAASESFTYDGTSKSNSNFTVTGLVGSDDLDAVVSGSIKYPSESPVVNKVMSHSFVVGLAGNYNVSYTDGALTMNTAAIAITVTADDNSKVYDGTPLTDSGWTLTSGTLISGDVLQVTVVGSITNVGTEDNEITLVKVMNGAEDVTANYTITEVDGLLTVTKKAVMITAASESFTYDGTSKSNSNFTVTGLVGSDDLDAVVSGSIKYPSESPVVNKVMSHSFVVGLAGNYNVSYTDGALTMNTAAIAITVTADDNSKVYDGTPLTDSGWTLTSGTLISGDVLQVTVVGSITNVGTVDNVITFVKVMNGAVDVTANYNITEIDGELEITKRPATIVVDNASKVFGTADPIFTGTVSNLINSGDLGTVSYIRNGIDEDVGVYNDVLRASYTPNANYTVDVTYGDFQIIPAEGAQLIVNGYTGVYDGNPHSISINNLLNDDTVYYSLTNNGSDWSTTKPDFTNVSSNLVYVLVENDNYDDRTGSATVTITPVTIVLTANSDSRVYDGTPLTNGGHSITTGSFVGSEGLESVSVSGSQTNVGSSANTITGHELKDNTLAMNYNISYLPGTLTITAAQIAVSVTANSDSRVYTGSEQTLTGYGSPVGLLSGHVLSGISASGSGTNVGSYPVTFTGTPVIMDGPVDVTENYDVTLVPGSLAITPAQIAVSVTANSDSRVYTGSEQTLTGYMTPVGLLSGHVISGISASGSGTNVGSYPVTFTGTPVIMDGLVDVTENYDVTLIPGSLAITPASNDDFDVEGYTGVYDGLEHGVSVTGQMPGDLIEYSLDGEVWSTTNPMFINVSTTTVYVRATNPNYTDRSDSALVTITPRPITITAASDDKIYDGDPLTNANFSISAGSLVTGHNLNATVTGSQTNVGSSPNIPSSAIIIDVETNVTSNYEVTYVNGLLRVDPATGPSLVIDSYNGIYDGASHGIELDGIIDGDQVFFYLLGDDEDLEEIDWNEVEWGSLNPTFVNVGSHTILVKVENPNYNDRTGSGTVDITPRLITITAGSASKVFDNQPLSNDSYTLTSGTIVEGEELFDVTVSGTITQVGSVPNIPSNAIIGMIEGPNTTSNYAVTYVNGTLTITQQFIPTIYAVNFIAGEGGSLEGTTTINTIAGTVWSLITVPTPVAEEGYEFIGWTPEFPANIYQNWTFTANFQEIEIEIEEEPVPEVPPVEEEEEEVVIEEDPIPEATPILPRTGQADPMFLYGFGALFAGFALRKRRR